MAPALVLFTLSFIIIFILTKIKNKMKIFYPLIKEASSEPKCVRFGII